VIEADEVDVNPIYGGNDTLGITCSELHARNRREDLNPYRRYPHTHDTDFSDVLFRSNFMLFSEKNRVKALKNQQALL